MQVRWAGDFSGTAGHKRNVDSLDQKSFNMELGKIYISGRAEHTYYREPYGDGFRDAYFDLDDSGEPSPDSPLIWLCLRGILAYTGWKITYVLDAGQIAEWQIKGQKVPMKRAEQEQAIKAIVKHYSSVTTRVKVVGEQSFL